MSLSKKSICHYFETIKIENREIKNLNWHLKRVEKTTSKESAKTFEKYVNSIFLENLEEIVYKLKVVYNNFSITTHTIEPYKKREIKSLKIVESNIKYGSKYLNREEIDALFLQKNGCDDVLITTDGYVKDTSIANIAFLKNGCWYTPKNALLEGTTKIRLVDSGFLKESEIKAKEILSFEKCALLNAMIGFCVIEDLKIC